jgi:carboxymethylenebutenolidase
VSGARRGARADPVVPRPGEEDTAMRKTVGVVAVALALVLAAPAGAADVKTKEIKFKSGVEEASGFLAMPDGKGPFPAVVVIQEWWGLNDWIKDNARRFAEKGYVALAPDLYRGKVTDDPMKARELSMGLPRDRAVRDLKGAVDALAAMEEVDKSKIGSIGWCMGGGFSLQLALNDDRVKACVICYGRVVTDPKELEKLNAAVLGIFGAEDRGIPVDGVKKFEATVKDVNKKVGKVEIHVYEGAGHGFMREKNNRAYKEDATRKAWEEIDKFFETTLKGK